MKPDDGGLSSMLSKLNTHELEGTVTELSKRTSTVGKHGRAVPGAQWRGALLLQYADSLNGEARGDGGRGVHPAWDYMCTGMSRCNLVAQEACRILGRVAPRGVYCIALPAAR